MISANEHGITGITRCAKKLHNDIPSVLKLAHEELYDYFKGNLKQFTFDMVLDGTEFQKTVWTALMDIPYGETRSYKEVAIAIGKPGASRAVGGANNKNKISVVIP